jgi:hypothetical protein
MPSFRHVEWKQDKAGRWENRGNADPRDEAGYDGYDLVAASGRAIFFFQGKIFILEKPADQYGAFKLRCL